MTDLRKAAEMALDALEMYQSRSSVQMFDVAITALRRALEQPAQQHEAYWLIAPNGEYYKNPKHPMNIEQSAQQEPVAWATQLGEYAHIQWGAKRPEYPMVYEFPLYTRHQARDCKECQCKKLIPLTDEQIDHLLPEIVSGGTFTVITYGRAVARAIEAAHGIKGDA